MHGRVNKRVRSLFSEELLLSASVLFLPILYMMAALALLSGIGLGRWVFPTGLLLWGAAVLALHEREGWQRALATLLLFLAVFALAAWGLSFTLDWGYDSRTYHAQAILALLEGVNPYWEPDRWKPHTYPAAHWLLSASLVLWTQTFTASFAFTLVVIVAAFLCARRFFTTLPHLSRFWRNVLAFLLAANPIATLGFSTHLNDGLLVSTLLSVFLTLLCLVAGDKAQGRTTRLRATVYVVALLVLLVNIKFTGLVFGGILGLTVLAYGVRRGASRKTLLQLAGLGSGAAILGVALFGFYPYATNAYRHGNPVHPFYPAIVFGEEGSEQKQKRKIIFFEETSPVLSGRSPYEKWWISLFSRTGETWKDPIPLPPFSSLSSASFLYGFSSFFSGSLLLCLTLVFFVRHRGAWVIMVGVAASIFLFGVGFSFRHAPQNWWLPLLFLVFLLAPDKKNSLPRAPLRMARSIVGFLCAISLLRFIVPGQEAVHLKLTVRELANEGGWYATGYFDYYDSGLSGLNLPILKECPHTADHRRLNLDLFACRP